MDHRRLARHPHRPHLGHRRHHRRTRGGVGGRVEMGAGMSVYDHKCADCQTCPSCGRSAWCENDRIIVVPCEHHGYCGDCNVENCVDCRLEAEREMYDSGVYDPRADPFYDHKAEVKPYPAREEREAREQAIRDADRAARDRYYAWVDSRDKDNEA